MLAPIATLIFLTALWVAVRVVADLLADSGSRIAAALRGKQRARMAVSVVAIRRPIRGRYGPRPLRARPELRAAA